MKTFLCIRCKIIIQKGPPRLKPEASYLPPEGQNFPLADRYLPIG
jgi:hypothetical protein